jgi:ferredoxin--NADP+ reductase
MPGKQLLNAVVTFVNDVSPRRRILQVVPYGWDFPEYRPGQFVSLGLPVSAPRCAAAEPERHKAAPDELIRRQYWIASSPLHREYLEFYVTLVPSGALTPRLFELRIGDRIWLSKRPAGNFTHDDSVLTEGANLVLCTSEGGLAPLISMLVTYLARTPELRVALIHGVRHSWDLGYRFLLRTMQDLRPNFTYLPTVRQPEDEIVPWNGELGCVQDVWQSGAIEKAWAFRPTATDTHVFLCGSPEMTDSMVKLLEGEGFAIDTESEYGQIHVEKSVRAAQCKLCENS